MEGVIADLLCGPGQPVVTYGFILGDDGVRYFFFAGGMQMTSARGFQDLGVGERVTFTPIMHPQGPRAIEIRTLE